MTQQNSSFKILLWRDGRAAECGGLENRYSERSGSWVRIPLSPPVFALTSGVYPEFIEGSGCAILPPLILILRQAQ